MAAKQKSINLIPTDKFSKTLVGRVINWLLSTFRVIVILVEFVVMGAFLSRFWLDAKNSDVTDELRDRQFVVEASQDIEDEMNTFMIKVNRLQTLSKVNTPLLEFMQFLPSSVPPEVTLTNFDVYAKVASLIGTTISENNVRQLATNLQANESVASVVVSNLSTNKETGFLDFQITISFK